MAKFRTKARAVDMLGRQQIADASTAISELFKNAHDAYADHVEVDFFRSDSLLVMRDDGIGMTPDEFESNWLVLGTDSKVISSAAKQAFRPSGKSERAVMGEKGIGRLAIAFLGPQVLVLTRSVKEKDNATLTMCYIHWKLFEQPSLNLDDVEIPIRYFKGDQIPTHLDVADLMKENVQTIEQLRKRFPQCNLSVILEDISDIQIDPKDFEKSVEGLSLSAGKSGTHYYIVPAYETILADIEIEKKTETKEFSKCLLGFCNLTFTMDDPPLIQTSFRFWSTDTAYEDLIASSEFFTKDDLTNADQFVSGIVDEYGQFSGMVRVYDQEYKNHIITWKEGGGKPTACGPFQVEFGYLQGNQRESMAEPEEFTQLNRKLNQIGGLYVYRDHIRILPYGNSDVDWLNIEERRNRGFAYYFFSYRRIYGAVCLSRELNVGLKEKAGREGFQKDKAYRHLKSVLENLFIQLAADFFRKEAPLGDYFKERKDELERLELARRKREKQITTKRKNLLEALNIFFSRIGEKIPESEVASLRTNVQDRMQLAAKLTDPDSASTELLDAEREANQKLSVIRTKYTVIKPRGVGLTKQLTRDWEAYQREHARLDLEVFMPFMKEVGEKLSEMAKQAKIYIDQRRRLQDLIQQAAEEQNALMKTEVKDLQATTNQTRRAAVNTARAAIRELRDTIEGVNNDLAHRDLVNLSPEQIINIRADYEQRIDAIAAKNTETLGSVRELLAGIAESLEKRTDISQLDIAEAMETELQSLREQVNADEELVQLGLAIAVINHEFIAAIKMIRSQMRELRSWAKANDELQPIYRDLRTNFDHLDAHLNLFTPLQRRLYRDRIDIQGKQIAHYIRALFSIRLERHHIQMDTTQDFLDSVMNSYPSTIYPVFVNLIDNFIYWLKDKQEDRVITLDCHGDVFHIENNGPPINKRDIEAIFEQGFSRKPGGRGLGLYISKKVLKREGMSLDLDEEFDPAKGVRFNLGWKNSND